MARRSIERRRRLIVDRDLQLRLVARMGCAFVGSLLLFLAIELGAPVVLGAVTGVSGWGGDVFSFRLRLLASFVALPLLSAVFVLFAVGVRSSFTFAGPLYRFAQVFRDLGALRIPRGVRIRRGDALQESARLFDASLVALHDRVEELQKRARSALRELADLEASDAELPERAAALRRELELLELDLTAIELLPRAPYGPPRAVEPTSANSVETPVLQQTPQ